VKASITGNSREPAPDPRPVDRGGGLKESELKFNRTNAGMSAGMLVLAIVSLVLPALFKYSHPEPSARMDGLHLAEGVAIVLLITYAASLLFTLKTHKRLIGGEPHPLEGERWSVGRAIVVLGLATVGVAVMSESGACHGSGDRRPGAVPDLSRPHHHPADRQCSRTCDGRHGCPQRAD
jgi:hypothetical protein